MPLRFVANLLIFCLSLWAVYISISAFFGVSLYFPLRIAEGQDIPYHRWQSVRISVFLTFAYFGVIHLLNGSRELYPIKFLETYLTILTVVGLTFIVVHRNATASELLVVAFLGFCATVLHLSSRPKFRKYFTKK